MNQNTIVTFLFLDTIYNRKKKDFRELSDVFIPLIKKVLSEMFSDNHKNGASSNEIKNLVDAKYGIDIPYNILDSLLEKIAKEGQKSNIIYNKDTSFQLLDDFYFEDFSEQVDLQKRELEELEQEYKKFLEIEEVTLIDITSLYTFVDQNRLSLSSYFEQIEKKDKSFPEKFIIEARFLDTISKTSKSYETLKKIYLGSIIASYLSTEPISFGQDIEFVLDTNFLIGLLNLNSIESNHTCQALIAIFQKNSHKISVLKETIEESSNLLLKKAKNFINEKVPSSYDRTSIIYNAIIQKMKPSDLEWLAYNLEDKIKSFGFQVINHDFQGQELKESNEYKYFLEVRNEELSALHDALAVKYVKKKRLKKKVNYFSDANCWFVVNLPHAEKHYPDETIRAEDLLNIYWLTTPNITPSTELVELGLTRLVSSTLAPNKSVRHFLRELTNRVLKYSTGSDVDGRLNPKELYRIGEGIKNHTISTETIANLLQKKGKDEFVASFKEISEKEENENKRKQEKLQSEFASLKISSQKSSQEHEEIIKKVFEKINAIEAKRAIETKAGQRYNESLYSFQETKWAVERKNQNFLINLIDIFRRENVEKRRQKRFIDFKKEFESLYSKEMFEDESFEVQLNELSSNRTIVKDKKMKNTNRLPYWVYILIMRIMG